MTGLPQFAHSPFLHSIVDDLDIAAVQKALADEAFDVRSRSYETGYTFTQRQIASAYALSIDYYNAQKWCSIKEWVDIAPTGPDNRLPNDRKCLYPHECCYLEIKDVQPNDWQVPTDLKSWNAQDLPARATYVPRLGHILLSRFKEPPGKCVIFLTEPSKPLYVSSNFIPLRTYPKIMLSKICAQAI